MRINFKAVPVTPNPAFPNQNFNWRPVLKVVIFYQHKQSNSFEAIVDSGSPYCFFHASIGDALGMDVRSGIEGPLGGVIGGSRGKVYYHKIRLLVVGESWEINAGFSYELSFSALLGQVGFFDNFVVTFDHTPHPPCFELQRIQRN